MNIDEVVQYWLTAAADDLPVAERLHESGDNHYALFFAHLYLEKILKAVVVRWTGAHAPRTHNLLLLAERAGLQLLEQRHDALLRFTGYNIATRYPDDIAAARTQYSDEFTRGELETAKETGEWLQSQLTQDSE